MFSKQQLQYINDNNLDKTISCDDLQYVLNQYRKQIQKYEIRKNTGTLKKYERDALQKYVVLCLYLLDDMPVGLDYANMKIIHKNEYDQVNKNTNDKVHYLYIKSRNKKMFVFEDYKTTFHYGRKIIPVKPKLNSILNLWLRFNKTDYLLTNSRNQPMSRNSLSKFVTNIFSNYFPDKVVNVTILRKLVVSEKFKGVKDQ